MCFRPPEVEKQIFCPSCGKEIMPTGGFVLKKCPFCKEPLPEDGDVPASVAPQASRAAATGTPAAPRAPKAAVPAAPAAPKAPGI